MVTQDRDEEDLNSEEDEDEDGPSVGYAWMEPDGTVFLNLFSTREGLSTNMLVNFRSNDDRYERILQHLGGLKEGEIKNVPAWPLTDQA